MSLNVNQRLRVQTVRSFPATHQVILLRQFEQQSFTVTVVGEMDVQVVLVVQVEAALHRSRSVVDLQPPLLIDLHADRKQRLFTALPLKG